MKPKNNRYKKNIEKNIFNYITNTQPTYNDIDSDPFLQGTCFIKIYK